MLIYNVGGFVRDILLGLSPKDRDYVVVGATAQDMLDKKFTQVGNDFPVFLHPETGEEYALARTERKSGMGYQGFLFDTQNVTLEQDLSRRDLTINAMAMDSEGNVIDPYGGREDLHSRTLRHVTESFREDPLRVLRVARFLARFGPEWKVDPATMSMMQDLVQSGELNHLTSERIWKEISRGLMEPHPQLMVRLLEELGVLALPACVDYHTVHPGYFNVLPAAVRAEADLAVRFGCTFIREWDSAAAKASRVPVEVREVAHLVTRCMNMEPALACTIDQFVEWAPVDQFSLIEKLDAIRQPQRCAQVLNALELATNVSLDAVREAIAAVSTVDVKAISASMPPGPAVGQAIRDARMQALAQKRAA